MAQYIAVLSIAGSDCSGGAGLQADIKTMSALGIYATTAVTAVTVQDGSGVKIVDPVSPDTVSAQIRAVMRYIRPKAVKIGMLCNKAIINAVADALCKYKGLPVIVDPVISASDGTPLLDNDAISLFKARILPLASIITPNIPEAQILSGIIGSVEEMAKILLGYCDAVLIKGGHSDDPDTSVDLLYCSDGNVSSFSAPRLNSENTHGTGCTLSSAIASFVASGCDFLQACRRAKEYVYDAIAQGANVRFGHGHYGPLNHLFNPQPMIKQKISK